MDASTTALQNQAIAMGSVSYASYYGIGQFTSQAYVGDGSSVQIYSGRGRLVSITILEGSSPDVKFYNTASISSIPQGAWLYTMPTDSKVGITLAGVQFTNGLVATIGSGVTINVTYSAG